MYMFYEGAFYPFELKDAYEASGTWPASGVEVNDDVFQSFLTPPLGKKAGAGSDGMPVWVQDDFVTQNLHASALDQRDLLMSSASTAIQPLQDAVDLDEATDDETALLKKWKQYRVALNRLDLSTAPDITWPVLPTVQTGS